MQFTYAEISRYASQFARELELRDIGKGDALVIRAENCGEWVIAFYGALMRGVVVVPLDVESAPDFVDRVIEETGPKLIITEKSDGHSEIDSIQIDELIPIISGHNDARYESKGVRRSDLAEIVFTSGTTAEPKGVNLTHENLLANIEAIETEVDKYKKWKFLAHPIRVLSTLPLSHVFGQMMGIFIPHLLRFEVHFQTRLNPTDIIKTIRRNRISVLATVPRVLETLRNLIEGEYEERGELESFESRRERSANALTRWWTFRREHRMFGFKFWSFVTGGAALSAETERFWSKLGFAVVQGYGMTESAALIAVNNPFNQKRGSLGEILSGQEVKIGEKGEILVRGKNVSTTDGGWLHTGDVGEVDDEGRLYFKGRSKDVIVTAAGLNVYPEDLEAALIKQPEISECAVIGVEGREGEEALAALLIKGDSDPRVAVDRANRELAQHQQIRDWIVWPEADFPRTPTQKIRKPIIAEYVKSRGKGASKRSGLADLIATIGGKAVGAVKGGSRLGSDLQLDSLSRTELIGALEDRYQIDLDEGILTETTTVEEITEMIKETGPRKPASKRFDYPYWSLRSPSKWFRNGFYMAVIYPIARLLCRVRIEGLENLEALRGPVIFASNHITHVDSGILKSAMPFRFANQLSIAMDGERLQGYRNPPKGTSLLMRIRFFFSYWLVVALFNAFPLPKRSGFRESFEFAGDAVDAGNNVLIFPEGELTQDGKLQEIQRGIEILADGLRIPVVPVVMRGLFELKIKKKRFARPGAVTVEFGKPILIESSAMAEGLPNVLGKRFAEMLTGENNRD